jgi:threonine/homoserine/homoserine lactone efflux protein
MATCGGMMIGLAIIMLTSAAGLGALLATSEHAFNAVKYLGAAYLIYLGVKTWRAAPRRIAAGADGAYSHARQRLRTGFLVAMSNPKAFIFFTALFPQFMDAHLPQKPQLAILALTFFVIEAAWQFAYASGGARLSGWLQSEKHQRTVNRMSGGAFIGAGMLLSGVSHH